MRTPSGLEKGERVETDPVGDALEALERQVAFAPFKPAHVGAVNADDMGEGFLAETACFAVGAQVVAYGLLQIAFHPTER